MLFQARENSWLQWVNYEAMQTSQINADAASIGIDRGFSLSYQQRRAWASAQCQLSGSRPAIAASVQCSVRLEGAFDVSRLKQAIQTVVDRYKILRTAFVRDESGELRQLPSTDGSVRWRHVDIAGSTPEASASQVADCSDEDCRESFVLDGRNLLRASLLTLAPDESVLVLTVPALCADAATMHTLQSEIAKAYESGNPSRDEDAIQYATISEWQQSQQEGEDAELGRKYWNTRPVAAPPVLALQRAAKGAGTIPPSSCAVHLSANAQSRLREIDREDVFLLGCWLALLRAVTSHTPIRVGVTCHGRSYEELRAVVGPLARVVPIVCPFPEGLRFDELLESLTERVDSAEDWQEFYERDDSEGPYEPVGFEYSEWPRQTAASHDFRWTQDSARSWSERFHIRLNFLRDADHLRARLEFDPNVFDQEYVARLSEQLAVVIDASARQADSPVDQLQILGDKEREFLIERCNDTQADYPRALLHRLIAEQAGRIPHHVAVSFQSSYLTYEELDKQANQLAHTLRQLRVGPEVRVGIYMHRSLEMMTAILGVLKAGGAYVPLEPGYPAERLKFMLEDARMSMVLTQRRLREHLPMCDAEVLCLDDEDDVSVIDSQPTHVPQCDATPDNLAYTLYTSGSTGRPKGAMISHRNLANYLHWCCKAYSVDEESGTPVHSSIAFDATITALFPPLLVGRTVVLLREMDGVNAIPEAMARTEGFSLMKITPAHLSLLSEFAAGNTLGTKTRMLVIGGDALASSRLSVWRRYAPQTRFINEYGPTETVVGCCIHEASTQDFASDSMPIGRPIANTRLYVLDRHLNPVPSGVPGELFIAGDGVCRGYLGRPHITAERFLPDELSKSAGSRMYRTGDLVVQRADGVLCFLGRLDHQVKIRSYRIELGEIEAQLESHPSVSQSVVIAQTLPSGDKSLAAYIEVSGGATPTEAELRTFLLAKLPEHMVPAVFVILTRLPLTAHGKVDRNALPDASIARSASRQPYVSPQTPAETVLASIWREVLKLDRIGIHDDFFASGGDSIQSILVVARAAKAGLHFTTRDLFSNPTIAGLAAASEKKGTVPATSCELTGPVPLTPIQHWFFEQDLPNPHHFNQSVLLDVRSDICVDWVRQVLERLVVHHDALRLRFTRHADGWVQEYGKPDGTVVVEEKDLSAVPAQARQSAYGALIGASQCGLNISHGPVVRAVLIRLGADTPVKLLLTVHHLVIDGVSWRILLDDFATAYQQLSANQAIQLARPTSSLMEWSKRLEGYANTDSALTDADHWTSRNLNTGSIPVDFDATCSQNTIATTASIQLSLGRDQTSILLHRISDVYHTDIDDLLLTSLAQALAHWNGSQVNLVDCEGHGRQDLFRDADVSRTVGWFTSIYPMCLDLSDAVDPGEQLKAIKEQRRRLPRKGVTYGVLRYLNRDLILREQLATLPRPQISFNYLGSIDEVCADPILGVSFSAIEGEQDSLSRRPYLLDMIAYLQNESLHLQLVYSTAVHKPATVQHLGNKILDCIESLLEHCLSPSAGGFTPSDFPDISLSQSELDELEAELE
jgi:amino acid adenylation domain-containing protein/non-ribosomal peptide synthase protein (TIGR01720 family)